MIPPRAGHHATRSGVGARCLLCSGVLDFREVELVDTRFGIGSQYHLTACLSCGLEHTVPRIDPEELCRLYETYYNFRGQSGATYACLRGRFLSSRLYRLWLAIDGDISFHARNGCGRLLDIGCNEGRGLELYRKNGFDAQGLEINATAAEVARSKGFVVHVQPVDWLRPREPYDTAVLSNVLEHAANPRHMLVHVRRILKPGGQVWISCPNSRSWLRGLFGPYWINWHVPFHVVHFSPSALSRLLESAGFTEIKVQQATPALWVAHSVIARVFAKPGKRTRQLRSPILVASLLLVIRALCFPALWLGNLLGRGDCLVVTARRRVLQEAG